MNRVAGVGTSIVLLAVGAVLAFAVSVETDGFNVNTIGWILMAVGVIGLIVSLIIGTAGTAGRAGAVHERTTTVVDHEPTRIIERERP